MKKLIAILVVAALFLAPIAAAKNSENQGKGKEKNNISLDDIEDSEPKGNAYGKDKGDKGNSGDGNETGETQSGGSNSQGKGQEKDNQGQLISEAQQVRREEFQELKDELKELGYTGPMSEYATAFNAEIKGLKDQIQGKVNETEVENFTQEIVREIAERELAALRDGFIADFNVSDENVTDVIGEMLENETEGDGADIEPLVDSMSDGFKSKFYMAATHGSDGEKHALKEQLKAYVKARNRGVAHALTARAAVKNMNYGQLRKQLRSGASVEDILDGMDAGG